MSDEVNRFTLIEVPMDSEQMGPVPSSVEQGDAMADVERVGSM